MGDDENNTDKKGWPMESCQLHVPPLNELADVLRQGLALNFARVQVDVVDCPDLSQSPFFLTASGIYLKLDNIFQLDCLLIPCFLNWKDI